jgi:anti-sigma factor RsiW
MKGHLDEQDIEAAVAGLPLHESAREHLASCLNCSREVAALQRLTVERRQQMVDEAPDWQAQQEQILSRLGDLPASRSTRRWMRPALAAAAVVAIAVGVGLLQRSTGVGPSPEIAVEEILAEADALLEDDSIPGFEIIDPGIEDPQAYVGNGVS